ncbi:MAG: U32 family peptidase [Ruminococcaceae bacterium]|nr:U32 family peptidase [Oscillospiraceae bacterium]
MTHFGMRTAPQNFDETALAAAVQKAHQKGAAVYLTCNILPRNEEIAQLPRYFEAAAAAGVDALIVADMGVIGMAKRYAPDLPLHISTQFGVVNYATARELYDIGASRVVLARELSLAEIAEIRAKTPSALELECFVHGAMCMSYSGRCLISNYLAGRDANHGDCAQPCRWRYEVIEPSAPDARYTVEETKNGSFIFNANDLNMIEHIPDLYHAGVTSFKIEGRAKAAYYAAVTTNAYRVATDGFIASGYAADYRPDEWVIRELQKVSHRPYTTGFYFGMPTQNLAYGGYVREYQVAAVAVDWADGILTVSQRNRFVQGDTLEVLEAGKPPFTLSVTALFDGEGTAIEAAPHPTMLCRIPCDRPVEAGSLLRRAL